MNEWIHIKKQEWEAFLCAIISDYKIYAPVSTFQTLDYEAIDKHNINTIVYNIPKPTTPLKLFFLPFKENVTDYNANPKPTIIIGPPACDLHALDILDEIYKQEPFPDAFYCQKRDNTILIGTDCHSSLPHCHCTSYGLKPFTENHSDIQMSVLDNNIALKAITLKGQKLIDRIPNQSPVSEALIDKIENLRTSTINQLNDTNQQLPDYEKTGELIKNHNPTIWKNYSKQCVSCGACATICPTCTCFLLVDRPNFQKIRQIDACQLPGFARIAAGEDPLESKTIRFKNRYLCKYAWKPERFSSLACTGCGRCIETCIGNINKNELFMEILDRKSAEKE